MYNEIVNYFLVRSSRNKGKGKSIVKIIYIYSVKHYTLHITLLYAEQWWCKGVQAWGGQI